MVKGAGQPGVVSIRAAFRFAWGAWWRHLGQFTAILLAMAAAWVVLELAVINGQQFGWPLWAAAHIAFLVFFAGLEAALTWVCLDIADGGSPRLADALAQLRLGPKYLAGQLIYLLLAAVGLVLLMVPGLYVLGRFALFGYRLADGETSLLASFGQSAALTSGAMPSLMGLALILTLLNVLGACLLGVGLFVTTPLSGLVLAAVYRQLTGEFEGLRRKAALRR